MSAYATLKEIRTWPQFDTIHPSLGVSFVPVVVVVVLEPAPAVVSVVFVPESAEVLLEDIVIKPPMLPNNRCR